MSGNSFLKEDLAWKPGGSHRSRWLRRLLGAHALTLLKELAVVQGERVEEEGLAGEV